MSIRKRGGVYWLDLRTPSGERVRRSCGTSDRKEAEEYHDRVKSEMWRTSKLGERERHTYEETVMRFLKGLTSDRDRSDKARHLRHFGEDFFGRHIDTIKATEIMAALPDQLYRGTRPGRPTSATRNRYLATIRAMLNEAANKWGWLEKAPKLFEERESNKRIRWITREEAQRLLQSINTEWLRDVTAFGFATGLRRANIFDLEWSQIDLVAKRAWIHPDQAKARKPIGVPLNREAVELIRKQIGKHHHLVFTRCGKRIKVLDWNQWKAACARANIENFRFHDVRHTWASWHVQGGTPLERLKELGAWATYEMVLRYAHLAPDHLAQHAEAVTVWAQPESDICGTSIRAAS